MQSTAVYCRVSTDRQAEQGLSLDVQEATCRRDALEAGALSVTVYREEGESGKSLDRPAFQRLLADLSQYDAVFVWALDRFTRSEVDWPTLTRACRQAGVEMYAGGQRVNLISASGRFVTGVQVLASQYQREDMLERVCASLLRRSTVLGLPHGRPAFGYRYPGQNRPWEVEPAEAPWVQAMFARYAGGENLVALARWLNEQGASLKHGGKQWWQRTVYQILVNPAYLGQHRYQGEVYPSGHPALIEPDLWRQVQARLDLQTIIRPRGRRSTSLSPLLRCGLCGGHVCRSNFGGKGADQGRYNCHAWVNLPASQRHPSISASAPKIAASLWNAVAWLADEESYREALARVGSRKHKPQTAAWEKRLGEIDRDLGYNLAAARAGAIDVDLLTRQNGPLLEEKAGLKRRLAQAAQAPENESALRGFAKRSFREALAALPGLPIEPQLVFLRALFSRVELHPGYLRCVWQHPDLPAVVAPLPRFYAPSRGCAKLDEPHLDE